MKQTRHVCASRQVQMEVYEDACTLRELPLETESGEDLKEKVCINRIIRM